MANRVLADSVGDLMIESLDELNGAFGHFGALLDGDDVNAAVAYAESLTASGEYAANLTQIRAVAYTDGGAALHRLDWVERGISLWNDLEPDRHPHIAYNLANAEVSMWSLAVRRDGWLTAWNTNRAYLHSARERFDRVGSDASAKRDLRAQALTNAGNSYDAAGRDLDAIPRYRDAIALDPSFGMAHGNLGMALTYVARWMGSHAPTVGNEGLRALDTALQHRDSIVKFGGPRAALVFEEERKKWPGPAAAPAEGGTERHQWTDPHLRWCLRNGLFLHVSHDCLRHDTQRLDPLYFSGLVAGFDETERRRVRDLVDAFNALKQDYVAARYLAWLVADRESPIREHTSDVADRVFFGESLAYARWGLRTGIGGQAFAAGTNVLDKVAAFVHLYANSPRQRPYFKTLAAPAVEAGKPPKPVDERLARLLEKPEQNRGLMALCDLSSDLEKPTPLRRMLDLRNAATHRFVVAHTEMVPESDDWIQRLRWGDLVRQTVAQLHVARAALVYLARLVDIHEQRSRDQNGLTAARPRPSLPLLEVDTRLTEYE